MSGICLVKTRHVYQALVLLASQNNPRFTYVGSERLPITQYLTMILGLEPRNI